MKLTLGISLGLALAASADAQMLSEDFEGGIPVGWNGSFTPGADTTWRHLANGQCGAISDMAAFTGAGCVTASDASGVVSGSLRTDSFVFPGPGPYQLRFDSILSIPPVGETVGVALIVQSATPSLTLSTTVDFQNNGMLEALSFDIPANPGAGIQAFDGLRCIGGNLIRHGARQLDVSGYSTDAWGAVSGNPLIGQGGFVAGQTRRWQAFYRDDVQLGCQTGQNSTNAVEITFAP